VKGIRSNYRPNTPLPYADIRKKFVELSANEYYNKHLEVYNIRFRNQLNEFAEGNLLFDAMEKEVWNKAAGDEAALHEYYDAHKTSYTWGPSVSAIFFTTSDKETTKAVRYNIQAYVARWRLLSENTNGKIIADSARFDISQIPGNPADIRAGTLTAPVMDTAEGSTNFVYIIDTYPRPSQKSFDEAKGMVINDYQALLEAGWIARLKKQYPVKVKEKVFKQLLRDQK
jgi:peptidyl-prolyl cis-trans isomerase SurA